ncbi:hypothetical protein PF005_g21311 [Phytophthora fragariae]|uniref:Retrotransposon gag domain-containing protein n=1 Tax=Phytophthora fragariae TaxID=53985 RepID=A0A6A3X4E1_9STRA|nr:hypothetical protein PF009_g20517 [Phytophthora fragariae]KAE8984814.1 hypothetical protein PF011_g20636 [Phytophthora fragariae]KAE9083241.1 hypothetical protein PF010_g21291 [Phytophthora fragariae]KAE9105631.1 hypothetical protein PF006_g21584 [Phytophthora fragariae]KAE9185298.1 hypothetical protein PF005_g21311 [Phytophthora fragariae]
MEKKEQTESTVRFKSRGRFKGTKDVKPFRSGGWRKWLEFQVELRRLYIFLNLDDSPDEVQDFREVVAQLLSGRDLDDFLERYENERADWPPRIGDVVAALEGLTRRYCPLGTRDLLHQEIRGLRKTRSMTVEEFDTRFHYLLQLERWVQRDDGSSMTITDQCRHYSEGMPRSWQLQVVPQRSRWENLDKLKTRYLQCERVEGSTERNGNAPTRPKSQDKPPRKDGHGKKPSAPSPTPTTGNKKRPPGSEGRVQVL